MAAVNASCPNEEIMDMIQDLCDISGYGIRSGIKFGESGRKAAAYILEKLHAKGLTHAKLEPIKVNNPFPDLYRVILNVDGEDHELTDSCFPVHWTKGTEGEDLSGRLVYLGDGSESYFKKTDVAGKIALIDEKFMRGYIPTAREATWMAKEKGAIAVFRANMWVESPQQQKREGSPTDVFPIPVICFSKGAGDYLREVALSGNTHLVTFQISVPHDVRDAVNVVCEIEGNGSNEEILLVGTHYDSGHFTGAVDNNASVALMIQWVEYFASKPKSSRNRSMIFAWCQGHDYDLNSGHYQFAEAHKERLEKAIVWDVDHAVGGIRYTYDDISGKIIPVAGETCEFYIIANNYTYSRLAAFSMEKYGFSCTQNRFETIGRGPQWGMAPDTCPWVNVASVPLYYHSVLDTPDKITKDQIGRAYAAHIEILENVDKTPEGFLYYDNLRIDEKRDALQVDIAILSENVCIGDTVKVWNDETRFYSDQVCYHHPAVPDWAGTLWDWGDGTPETVGGPTASHVYRFPGRYTITMTVTNVSGVSAKANQTVTVLAYRP